MIEFNSIKEIQKYYKKEKDTFEFKEGLDYIDVKFNFQFYTNSNIDANRIVGRNIYANNIDALSINCFHVKAKDSLYTTYLDCFNIDCENNLYAKYYISAQNIKAKNIETNNLKANSIKCSILNCYGEALIYKDLIADRIINTNPISFYGKINELFAIC